MVLKLLLIFALFYLVARTVGNMIRAVLNDPKTPPPMPPPGERPPRTTWEGPRPRSRQGARPDVEDARWIDLD